MTEMMPSDVAQDAPPAPAAARPALARDLDGNVAILTMAHAPHNLLGELLVDEFFAGLAWASEVNARAVVIRSSLRHFSAGAEMAAFECHQQGVMHSLPLVELLRAFDELPMPIIASVNGVCVGGGFELALAS